jgi:hypothetical protein
MERTKDISPEVLTVLELMVGVGVEAKGAGPAVQAPDQLVSSLTRCPGVGDTVGKGRD